MNGAREEPTGDPHREWEALLTIPEAAKILSVSVQRGYELARNGTVPAVRMGRQVRVDPVVLRAWLAGGGD